MSYCKVSDCRYANTHVTAGHKCGDCKQFGHGRQECDDEDLKEKLKQYHNDTLPNELHCTMKNCRFPSLHTNSGHTCGLCGKNHSLYDCTLYRNYGKKTAIKKNEIKCPLCQTKNLLDTDQKKVYGVDETTCKVCLDKQVEVFLPACGHVCLCGPCADKMKKEVEVYL